jgi:hypothetical protein
MGKAYYVAGQGMGKAWARRLRCRGRQGQGTPSTTSSGPSRASSSSAFSSTPWATRRDKGSTTARRSRTRSSACPRASSSSLRPQADCCVHRHAPDCRRRRRHRGGNAGNVVPRCLRPPVQGVLQPDRGGLRSSRRGEAHGPRQRPLLHAPDRQDRSRGPCAAIWSGPEWGIRR